MIEEQDILELFIQSIEQQIESLENTEYDKITLDELKLLLSDNVTKDGKIQTRYSLLNKYFHHSFKSYKDVMDRYTKGHMNN